MGLGLETEGGQGRERDGLRTLDKESQFEAWHASAHLSADPNMKGGKKRGEGEE